MIWKPFKIKELISDNILFKCENLDFTKQKSDRVQLNRLAKSHKLSTLEANHNIDETERCEDADQNLVQRG